MALLLLTRDTEGCSCAQSSNEDKFCAGDFALKVTVTDVSESDKYTKFSVSIDTEYRYTYQINIVCKLSSECFGFTPAL